jgi:formate dehydrogenase maturation protein FdhE
MLKRPGDRRRERVDAADRKVRSRAWSDAVRALEHDPAAKVACPVCHAGNVAGDWVAFKSGAGGEWVLQCDACGAWYTEVRSGG